jgi:hypothetical protein
MSQQGLTARAHDRILKVARTVADLQGAPAIEPKPINKGRWIGRSGRKERKENGGLSDGVIA